MTDAEILAKVKKGLGITGTFQDDTLNVYIEDVKAFMATAGVDSEVVTNEASVGCIMRGVADLWNYGAGSAYFSEYFKMRLLQLKTLAMLTITAATGTTVAVIKDGAAVSGGSVVGLGDVLTISVTGGTLTVNGEAFTSGESYTVTGKVAVVSAVA